MFSKNNHSFSDIVTIHCLISNVTIQREEPSSLVEDVRIIECFVDHHLKLSLLDVAIQFLMAVVDQNGSLPFPFRLMGSIENLEQKTDLSWCRQGLMFAFYVTRRMCLSLSYIWTFLHDGFTERWESLNGFGTSLYCSRRRLETEGLNVG